ncbi:aminotransferase class I/II-fold pyridoxal phosphate-dependent enzyme [Burkholderia multivorans]|uniref:aminotransferase class I/II-fold pyridoxal phosphate-dependent enzyme n=1 Tax=Burkholderia multivorans TaxID=87883 RepID=UPI0019D31BFB|nr:aminotransferase class I/II-fold pyridoxal phosphate-dependent enzyme [Burkholderia multivorans]MBN6731252.1 aminotransferase class I/II-fold pyridoxal phosphate-dependent enzyme [Burkholderia multivorans]MBN6733478.1 aminotransferase class I/II-fold pyridoxal phosphate-dependent enzyme [Burkholderia multivorans]MBN7130384.1 aminotransferase class I/II-fold pyridoxal phosphate-dependent enzyme [Burkholderia multivorans]MBN8165066.1 aminotransferase class I/II-fold pyridoxal phosphate-depende
MPTGKRAPCGDVSEPALTPTPAGISRQIDPTLLSRYGPPAGHDEHRPQMAQRLLKSGVRAKPANILLCNGAQQVLCVAMVVLCKPDTVVINKAFT